MTKIYNRIVIDIETLQILEEDSYEYSGPVAHCKGGGGSTTTNTQDTVYNARMAEIAESQQGMAEEYFGFWEETYKPYEEKQIQANTALMPYEIEAEKAQLQGISEITPVQTAYTKGILENELAMLPQKNAVSSAFYEEALKGVDVRGRMDAASADMAQSLKGAEDSSLRTASRMGLNAGSGRVADMLKTSSLDRARATGMARSTTRLASEDSAFQRLLAAQQYTGLPSIR